MVGSENQSTWTLGLSRRTAAAAHLRAIPVLVPHSFPLLPQLRLRRPLIATAGPSEVSDQSLRPTKNWNTRSNWSRSRRWRRSSMTSRSSCRFAHLRHRNCLCFCSLTCGDVCDHDDGNDDVSFCFAVSSASAAVLLKTLSPSLSRRRRPF